LATPQSVYAFLNLFCLPLNLFGGWLRLFGQFFLPIHAIKSRGREGIPILKAALVEMN
jgi:hypothetical protein